MLVRPDDEVYRVDAVWLGPQGMTLPWSARYAAYGIWMLLFVGVLLVEAVLPMRVSVPPVWEVVLTVLATYALTGVIDHDRPIGSLLQLLRVEVCAPRPTRDRPPARGRRPIRFEASRVRVRSGHDVRAR